MPTEKIYSLSADFPNNKVDSSKLIKEIQGASITVAVDYINADASNCTVFFKANISAGEETTLDGLVAAHDGDPLPDNIVQVVEIQEEGDKKTGGKFQTASVQVVIDAPVGWKEGLVTFPIPIAILSAYYVGHPDFRSDEGEFLIGEDTLTGALTANVAIGDTVIPVSQTVVDNAEVGYFYKLFDGTNTDDLGMCLSIDKAASTITVENAVVSSFSAATPTLVKQTVKLGTNLKFVHEGVHSVGESKIGGSYLPAGTEIKMRYNNLDATRPARKFNVRLEYLY